MTVFVAVTGASGAIYAKRAFWALADEGVTLWATYTPTAAHIVRHELGIGPEGLAPAGSRVVWFALDDLSAPPASGSSCADAMLIIPCSMGTLGRIAHGIADNLVTRAADVILKERKTLVLVPRETPLNLIQLRNMTTLAEAGAIILPACPYFYDRPQNIEVLVDAVVRRALAHLGLPGGRRPKGDT